MKLDISQQEREDIVRGLQIRMCIVETGDPAMRANDAINCGESRMVRALTEEQRALVVRHTALVTRLLVSR